MKRFVFAVAALLMVAGATNAIAQYYPAPSGTTRAYSTGTGQSGANAVARRETVVVNTWANAPRGSDYAYAQAWGNDGRGRVVWSESSAGTPTPGDLVSKALGPWQFRDRYGYFPDQIRR